jgi:hypothetical protein
MNLRSFRIPAVLGALLAPLLTASAASAQTFVYAQPRPYGVYDGPRFRGGIDLEGGALAVPGVATLGSIGLRAQMGVQIDNQWGVYFQPSFDVLFGAEGGPSIGLGVMVDYTFPGIPISVGIGPELGAFVAVGGTGCTSDDDQTACAGGSTTVGAFYGARLHFAYYPVIVRYAGTPRRRALAIGFDLRILDGAFGSSSVNSNNGSATATYGVGVSPMLSIGYTAF